MYHGNVSRIFSTGEGNWGEIERHNGAPLRFRAEDLVGVAYNAALVGLAVRFNLKRTPDTATYLETTAVNVTAA